MRCLQVSALICTAALVSHAAPEKQLPFRGSIQTLETSIAQPPILVVDGSGIGRATHLGRFAMTYDVSVNLATRASVGLAEFTAANGDTIFTELTGQGTPIEDSNSSMIVETYTIVGGTGRFIGATGTFTIERLLDRTTGISDGSIDGHIVLAH